MKNFTKCNIVALTALFLLFGVTQPAFAQSNETSDVKTARLDAEGDLEPLPDFVFQGLGGENVTPENLPQGMPVIVIYFDPDCDHCEKQAKMIAEAIGEGDTEDKFKGISIVWVSWGEPGAIQNFADHMFSDAKHDPMIFCKDSEFMIDQYFGYSEVPSIFVYSNKWQRVATFRKETSPATLIPKAWK